MRRKFSYLIYITVSILLVLLQTSLLPQFGMLKVKPDLVLLFIVSVGLLKGYREGTGIGIVVGLLTGIISGNPWGIYMLIYSLAGFTAGLVSEKVEPDPVVIPLLSGTIASLGAALLLILLGQWLDLFFPIGTEFYKILTFISWNALCMLPIYLLSKNILVPPEKHARISAPSFKNDYILQ